MKFLGQKLKTLRDARGLSQTELYKLTNIKPGYISEIENGKKQPSDTTVKKLCEALKIDELYFYVEESRLLTELFPGNAEIEKIVNDSIQAPYAAVNEKAARYGFTPEDLNELLDTIIKHKNK